jgi:hypothetical protein
MMSAAWPERIVFGHAEAALGNGGNAEKRAFRQS